jgi:hypothetical protein
MSNEKNHAHDPRRQYAIFGETDDGTVVGEVENSFSMGFSRFYVRVFDDYYDAPKTCYTGSFPYQTQLLDDNSPITIIRFFTVRVSRKNTEFIIDWSPRRDPKVTKWSWRNLPFKVNKEKNENL